MNSVKNNGLKSGVLLRHDTYRIERILGQGGFGITYLATDLSLERYVAIKEFFPKDYCDREESTSHITVGTSSNVELVTRLKAKFLKEARNIAKFDHPGIIKIHTAFEENNTAYYVMDYIEGSNLNEIVKNSGPLSESKAVNYITQVGDALDYIHKHNVNHLDIKPANIMIRKSDDRPILIDFGLSKQYDSEGNQTSTTPTGISHGYAPMEQYKAGGVSEFSPQTDVYSLAATLYYLISGKIPPHATDLIEESLSFPTDFPMNLQKAISKAMSSARKNRHESVAQFLKALKNCDFEEEATTLIVQTVNDKKETTIDKLESTNHLREKSSRLNIKWILSLSAVIIIVIVFFISVKPNSGNQYPIIDDSMITNEAQMEYVEEIGMLEVENMIWDSPLGKSIYSGEINGLDSIPNGKGIAKIINGNKYYIGSVYDGEFKMGNMDGQTTYTLFNGDTFIGTFKNNKYYQGKYTIKETEEYFEGTFKDGQPDQGNWYDKNGTKL